MPLPTRREDESRENFISRCMSDNTVSKDFPDRQQRIAVCMSKAAEDLSASAAADLQYNIEEFGYTEDVNEDNFYVPSEDEYVSLASLKITVDEDEEEEEDEEEMDEEEDDVEEIDAAKELPGLWENIRRKREREGKNYKPAKPGDKDRPDPKAWKKAQNKFIYENPKTGERYSYIRQGNYKKDGTSLVYKGKAAEYQGRKVKLNKPFRTPDGPKKFAVYTRNDSGKVVIVRFGDPTTDIKRDDPERRKSFRARHHCDTNPGPRWKARYWSCMQWRSNKKVEG